MSDSAQKWAIVGVAAGVVGVAAISYLIYKEEEEKERRKVVASRPTTIEVQIPKMHMKTVIGRRGQNINDIRNKTHTRIFFKDELETDRYCVAAITGIPDDVKLAEIMIHQTIALQPYQEMKEFYVDNTFIGRIIGRGGQMISSIQSRSGCKIDISYEHDTNEVGSRRVTLRGSKEQITLAKSMIDEIIHEEMSFKSFKKSGSSSVKVQPLFLTSDGGLSHEEEEVQKLKKCSLKTEQLTSSSRDAIVEIYVSSVNDPGSFFVQKVGPKSVALDKLVEDMTGYYDKLESRLALALSKAAKDDIVAARASDESWYRAKVVDVTPDDYDESQIEIAIEFVDYGGMDRKPLTDLFKLEDEFLQLDFQAISACMADIKPK